MATLSWGCRHSAASSSAAEAMPDLAGAEVSNRDLLDAVRALSLRGLRWTALAAPVDYKNLGAEELGSVYESLLELQPELDSSLRHLHPPRRHRQRAQDHGQLLHAPQPRHQPPRHRARSRAR